MKNLLLLITILCIFSTITHAQSDTITIKKRALGTIFQKNGKSLSLKGLEKALKKDAEATAQFRNGKNVNTVASVFSFAGGFMVGYEVGRSLGSGQPMNPAMIGVGVGLIGIGIPFSISAQKKFKEAVHTYNTNRRKTAGLNREQELYFTFSGNSVGLMLRF